VDKLPGEKTPFGEMDNMGIVEVAEIDSRLHEPSGQVFCGAYLKKQWVGQLIEFSGEHLCFGLLNLRESLASSSSKSDPAFCCSRRSPAKIFLNDPDSTGPGF
jgi:hypothetical protein